MKIDDSLDPKTRGKILQFIRLLISYNDFKHAGDIATYILQEKLHNRKRGESRMLLEALSCAMIIAYCRPFSGNDRSNKIKIPNLPKRFLKILDNDERELHVGVMEDRNTVLAHSDSEGWDMQPIVNDLLGGNNLLPLSNDTRAPLTRVATKRLHRVSYKLREAVFERRMEWEPELVPYFDKTSDVWSSQEKRAYLRGAEEAKREFTNRKKIQAR